MKSVDTVKLVLGSNITKGFINFFKVSFLFNNVQHCRNPKEFVGCLVLTLLKQKQINFSKLTKPCILKIKKTPAW